MRNNQRCCSIKKLINGAYRGESSKAEDGQPKLYVGGERTNEEELTEILLDSTNTLLKFTKNDQILGLCFTDCKRKPTYSRLYHLNFKMVVLVPNCYR
jgi:hypothetical protein